MNRPANQPHNPAAPKPEARLPFIESIGCALLVGGGLLLVLLVAIAWLLRELNLGNSFL